MDNKYLHYELDDLLSDDDFVNWVLLDSDDNQWKSWLVANPQLKPKVKEAKRILTLIKFKEDPVSNNRKKDLWERIESSTNAKEIPIGKTRGRWKYVSFGLVAASLALLIILRPVSSSITTTNMESTAMSIQLPNNSEIVLDQGSEITYNPDSWGSERHISLSGVATFDVTKGNPFIVQTKQGKVSVLGTRFTVTDNGKQFNVEVEEGKVQVDFEGSTQILTAGQNYVANPYQHEMYQISEINSPTETIFDFQARPIDEALQLIEDYYDVDIIEGSQQEKMNIEISASFSSRNTLDEALQSVLWPVNIEFNISEKKVQLIEQD